MGAGWSWQPNRVHACARATQTALARSFPRICRLSLATAFGHNRAIGTDALSAGWCPCCACEAGRGACRGGHVRTCSCPPRICVGATPNVRALVPAECGCWLEVLWLAPRIRMARTIPVLMLVGDRERIARVRSDREPARAPTVARLGLRGWLGAAGAARTGSPRLIQGKGAPSCTHGSCVRRHPADASVLFSGRVGLALACRSTRAVGGECAELAKGAEHVARQPALGNSFCNSAACNRCSVA